MRPAAEFLDAADRLGMLVMDENRNFGASPELIRQLQWEIRRDHNHPSVILWSVFNEEPSQGTEMGYELVRRQSAAVKDLDTTRPVTAAQSNSDLNPINASQAADVAGFNYVYRDFDPYHKLNPDKPMFSSEDTSTVMTRDEFITNRKEMILDSYDDVLLPWGLSHRDAWMQVATRPFMAGSMVWTGFDYRGEPQPLSWPAAGSSFGIMDLCGFPKSQWSADHTRAEQRPDHGAGGLNDRCAGTATGHSEYRQSSTDGSRLEAFAGTVVTCGLYSECNLEPGFIRVLNFIVYCSEVIFLNNVSRT